MGQHAGDCLKDSVSLSGLRQLNPTIEGTLSPLRLGVRTRLGRVAEAQFAGSALPGARGSRLHHMHEWRAKRPRSGMPVEDMHNGATALGCAA